MPLSGTYYYPQVQAPNSSYASMDLRALSALTGAANLGRLQVSGSVLYYVDPSGNAMRLSTETLAQADLPAGSTALSGAIIWLSDVKTLVTYGPEGFVRITTGSL